MRLADAFLNKMRKHGVDARREFTNRGVKAALVGEPLQEHNLEGFTGLWFKQGYRSVERVVPK